MHIPFFVIANMSQDEIKSILGKVDGTKVLLTSAHPYVPKKSQLQMGYETHSLSIADLRKLDSWYKIIYVSHDILEEYKPSERSFVNDYDLFCLHYPDRYLTLTRNLPVVRLPLPVVPLKPMFLFRAIFFVSEWDYYRLSKSPSEFIQKFPFLLNAEIALKPPSVPGDSQYRARLQSLGVRIIDPDIRAEEILCSFKGDVITNASSGVAQLGITLGLRTFVLKDFESNRFSIELKKFLIELSTPFDSETINNQLSAALIHKKIKDREQELIFSLQESLHKIKTMLDI
jgi:hypothetical protein